MFCICIIIFKQKLSYLRVANVRHSHMILTIRNIHILLQKRLNQVKKLINVPRIHYIANNGTASYFALVSSFICMFHLFMSLGICEIIQDNLAFYEYMGHTHIHQ